MKILITLLLLCQVSLFADRPNILMIAIDDLNDWVGFLKGHPQVQTPNMDRLAKRGIAFTNAHCSTPVCKASRTALLTGFTAENTGVYSNKSKFKTSSYTLLPQYFAKHGYSTYGTGKIYHGSNFKGLFQTSFNTEQRWSPFEKAQVQYTDEELPSKGTDNPRQVVENGPGKKKYILPLNRMSSERNPTKKDGESFDWGSFEVDDEEFGDGKITSWALEQLKQHKKKEPFFMAVGYYRPHIPLFAPKKYFDLYPLESLQLPPTIENDLDDIPQLGQDRALIPGTAGSHQHVIKHGQWKEAVQAYLACVSFVDAQIGHLLDYLDKSPYAENTIVVLFSDHGWHLGEKQAWGKFTGWIHSTKVPFIISPTGMNKGDYCHEPVSLLDIYPTLIDLAKLPELKLDGTSITPLLKEPSQVTNRVVKTQVDEGNFSLINKEWHYIEYKDGSGELYNRLKDPLEYHNLFKKKEYSHIIKKLKSSPN